MYPVFLHVCGSQKQINCHFQPHATVIRLDRLILVSWKKRSVPGRTFSGSSQPCGDTAEDAKSYSLVFVKKLGTEKNLWRWCHDGRFSLFFNYHNQFHGITVWFLCFWASWFSFDLLLFLSKGLIDPNSVEPWHVWIAELIVVLTASVDQVRFSIQLRLLQLLVDLGNSNAPGDKRAVQLKRASSSNFASVICWSGSFEKTRRRICWGMPW